MQNKAPEARRTRVYTVLDAFHTLFINFTLSYEALPSLLTPNPAVFETQNDFLKGCKFPREWSQLGVSSCESWSPSHGTTLPPCGHWGDHREVNLTTFFSIGAVAERTQEGRGWSGAKENVSSFLSFRCLTEGPNHRLWKITLHILPADSKDGSYCRW